MIAARPKAWASPETARAAAEELLGPDGLRRLLDLRGIVRATGGAEAQRLELAAMKAAAADLDEAVRKARATIQSAVQRLAEAAAHVAPAEARATEETASEVDRWLGFLAGNVAAAGRGARRRAGRPSGWRDPMLPLGRVALVRLALQALPALPKAPAAWAYVEIAASGQGLTKADQWRDLRAKWSTAISQATTPGANRGRGARAG